MNTDFTARDVMRFMKSPPQSMRDDGELPHTDSDYYLRTVWDLRSREQAERNADRIAAFRSKAATTGAWEPMQ